MITFFRSAPEKPCVLWPAKSTDERSNLTRRACTRNIASLPRASGRSTRTHVTIEPPHDGGIQDLGYVRCGNHYRFDNPHDRR
jgi:hypothetical protein